MTIAFIAGSPGQDSRSARLLQHSRALIEAAGYRTHWISVRDLPAQALIHADFNDPSIAQALAALAQSSAVVIASPIYKAAYSGVLKSFLDLLPQDGLHDKAILPLATAGSPAHLLALDYALRPVLAALAARDIVAGVYALDGQVQWHSETGIHLDPSLAVRLEASIAQLLQRVRHSAPSDQNPRLAHAAPIPFKQLRCAV